MELIIHGRVLLTRSLTSYLYVDTEHPLDGVNGALTRSYISLAKYRPGIWLVLNIFTSEVTTLC